MSVDRERWDRNAISGLASSDYYEIVTFSDSQNFDSLTRELYFPAAGTVAVVRKDDTVVSIPVIAGLRLGVQCKRINATGSDSISVLALW